ncbi:MAG: anti-sigma factor [Streptosporangiaceae bacterium]
MTEETTAPAAAAVPTAVRGEPAAREAEDRVTIRMPAEGAYLSVLRTATAGLAARLDFTLDEIEDLRIAVDEACGLLLSQAAPGADLDCDFTLAEDSMTIAVSVPSPRAQLPARDTFAWTVLSALAGSVDAWAGPGDRLTVMLRKTRELSRSG